MCGTCSVATYGLWSMYCLGSWPKPRLVSKGATRQPETRRLFNVEDTTHPKATQEPIPGRIYKEVNNYFVELPQNQTEPTQKEKNRLNKHSKHTQPRPIHTLNNPTMSTALTVIKDLFPSAEAIKTLATGASALLKFTKFNIKDTTLALWRSGRSTGPSGYSPAAVAGLMELTALLVIIVLIVGFLILLGILYALYRFYVAQLEQSSPSNRLQGRGGSDQQGEAETQSQAQTHQATQPTPRQLEFELRSPPMEVPPRRSKVATPEASYSRA